MILNYDLVSMFCDKSKTISNEYKFPSIDIINFDKTILLLLTHLSFKSSVYRKNNPTLHLVKED